MPAKTWNFTFTPPDGSVTTRTGVPHEEAIALIGDLMYGRIPAPTTTVEHEAEAPVLAHAA
jgi:hypothetical protein